MIEEETAAVLNQPLGYEIASLLQDEQLTFSEIKSKLQKDHNSVHDEEINRVLSSCLENDLVINPLTRGKKKRYTLNHERFSATEINLIIKRAKARQTGKAVEYGEKYVHHTNFAHIKSSFVETKSRNHIDIPFNK